MNGKAKMIRMLGVALLSAAVILASQSPAAAKSKRSSKSSTKAQRRAADAKRKAAEAVRKAAEAQRKAAEERARAWRRVGRSRTVHTRTMHRSRRDGGTIISFGSSDGRTRFSVNLGGGSYQTIRRWIPATYETRIQRVLVEPGHHEWRTELVCVEPGRYETRYVPAVEEVLYDSRGNAHRIIVTPSRVEKVWVPAKYETRRVQVWVPPRYETRQVRVLVPGRWVTETVRTTRRSGLNLSALFSF